MNPAPLHAVRTPSAQPPHLAAVLHVFGDARCGVAVLGADGRIEHGNRALAGMLGRAPGEVPGLHWSDVLDGRSLDAAARIARAAAETGDFRGEVRVRQRPGAVARLEVTGRRVDGCGRWLVHCEQLDTGAAEEAVVRRLAERAARLERSNAELEGFAFTASHELQEPLRSIELGAETVLRAARGRLLDDERELLAQLGQAAGRMSAQVDALMQMARVALDGASADRVPVQLALDDALRALRSALRRSGARVEISRPLPSVPVPRAEMGLVFQNLVANAIRFRRDGTRPRISVSGRLRDGAVEIRVADDGIGLSDADRARIFAIFGRVEPDAPGTGMGLAVCRRILERRGGTIGASSDGRGRGSEFTVRLPVDPARSHGGPAG